MPSGAAGGTGGKGATGGQLPQLTAAQGRVSLAKLRPTVDARIDLARARGKVAASTRAPSLMPAAGAPFGIYVGNVGHAKSLGVLREHGIGAVLNCAPGVCKDPTRAYRAAGIAYLELDAKDDRSFPLLERCLAPASEFIAGAHASQTNVLVHCMAGVNRSAAIVVAFLMCRDNRALLELFAECSAARPSILQNASFQLQLCELALTKGLL